MSSKPVRKSNPLLMVPLLSMNIVVLSIDTVDLANEGGHPTLLIFALLAIFLLAATIGAAFAKSRKTAHPSDSNHSDLRSDNSKVAE